MMMNWDGMYGMGFMGLGMIVIVAALVGLGFLIGYLVGRRK